MARDNGVLILGAGKYEGHIRQRSRKKQPYFDAFVSVRGTGRRYPSGEFPTYDEAQAGLVAFVKLLLEMEAAKLLEGEAA